MPQTVCKLRVFVASPGDVPQERERIARVVDSVNRGIGAEKGLVLDLIRWETHAWPSAGADAQDIINRQLGLPDIFIGIMWRRIGTPTPRALSGTVEEFDLAFEAWRSGRVAEVMCYFKTDGFYPRSEDELVQMSRVLSFRERLNSDGLLVREYVGSDEFEQLVHDDLVQVVRRYCVANSDRVDLTAVWEGEGADFYTEDKSPLLTLHVVMSTDSNIDPIVANAAIVDPDNPASATELVLTGSYYNDEYIQMMYRNRDRTTRQMGVALLQLSPTGHSLRVQYAGFSPTRSTFVGSVAKGGGDLIV